MKKEELIEQVAKKCALPKSIVKDCLDSALEEITKILSQGGEVILPGFGVFKVGERKARIGRNPKTGAQIEIPAKKTPKFRAGKILKEAVR